MKRVGGLVWVAFSLLLAVMVWGGVTLAQTPEPLYICQPVQAFTCTTVTPVHTASTVPLLTPTPSVTPTRDFSQAPIFQTATAIKLTREAFPSPTEEVWTGATLPPATSTKPDSDSVTYRVITPNGLNIRTTPSVSSPVLGVYRAGDLVEVSATETQTQGGVVYVWGKTPRGYIAIKSGTTELAREVP